MRMVKRSRASDGACPGSLASGAGERTAMGRELCERRSVLRRAQWGDDREQWMQGALDSGKQLGGECIGFSIGVGYHWGAGAVV